MSFKKSFTLLLIGLGFVLHGQALRIPLNTNFKSSAGREVSGVNIEVKWSAPGVKGREGKIWGTDIAYFGTQVLGYGSDVESPWRAGADECTTISFSEDVTINGASLKAGVYAFFIELQESEAELIFNKNTAAWGSYFYDKSLDVLRVKTKIIKDQPMVERLDYVFSNQKADAVDLSLKWEHWSIPMTIGIDTKKVILSHIKAEMTSELGFDPPSLVAAANWCLNNDVNLEQALSWITMATNPSLGAQKTFGALSTKAQIMEKLGQSQEAKKIMDEGLSIASPIELHQYGRRLIAQSKVDEAFEVLNKNYTQQKGQWPTTVGMMRAYNAKGDVKKALEFAEKSLELAPDDLNRNALKRDIEQLRQGKLLPR